MSNREGYCAARYKGALLHYVRLCPSCALLEPGARCATTNYNKNAMKRDGICKHCTNHNCCANLTAFRAHSRVARRCHHAPCTSEAWLGRVWAPTLPLSPTTIPAPASLVRRLAYSTARYPPHSARVPPTRTPAGTLRPPFHSVPHLFHAALRLAAHSVTPCLVPETSRRERVLPPNVQCFAPCHAI